MNNTLYIRADGNAQIGLGHVMRCLSIAMAARSLGRDCIFLTADDSCRETIEQRGFSAYTLNSDWSRLESELPVLCAYLAQHHAQRILIDSYYVTEPYLRILCEKVRVAYLDDVAAFVYPCHTLINYNVYAPTLYRPIDYPSTQMLLGPGFAPLRPEFHGKSLRKTRPAVSSILFTTGGSDLFGLLPCLMTQIFADSDLNHLLLYVIIGRFHQYRAQLETMAKSHPNLHIYVDTDQMATLMQQCDLAVSAGGSTLYELCACSVPTVCFSLADNQMGIVNWFSEQGYAAYAGDVRNGIVQCADQICTLLKKNILNFDLRKECAARMREVLQGNGAQKIVYALT